MLNKTLLQNLLWLISILISVGKFVDLSSDIHSKQEVTVFDEQIVGFVHACTNPAITPFVTFVTQFGSQTFLVATSVVLICGLLLRRKMSSAAFLAAVGIGGAALMEVSKAVFHRPRPNLSVPIAIEPGYSFPSGHSMLSTCVYGAIAIIVWHLVKPLWLRLLAICLIALLIIAVALSRVYLGVHYPSDVLAGILLGWAWLSLCALTQLLYQRKRPYQSQGSASG